MGGRSAERRSGARRNTRGACPRRVKDARERAYDAARQAPARRLASHNAGRSPLGAPPWRFWASGPRFRLLRRPPSYNGGQLPSGSVERAPRSQVVVPGGRLPGPPGASGYAPPAARRHSPLRLLSAYDIDVAGFFSRLRLPSTLATTHRAASCARPTGVPPSTLSKAPCVP